MNERIKELAKQAEQAADAATYAYDDDTGKWQKIWNEVYDQKFAELIIRGYEQFLPDICPWANAGEEGPMKGWHVQFVARKHFGLE